MSKKTERLKKRLREFPGGLSTEAFHRIERLEKQVAALQKFAAFVNALAGSIARGTHGGTVQDVGRALHNRIHRVRNDVRRLEDPDDDERGCCG